MATTLESEFQRAAQLKWPTARVSGDGPYALYCEKLDRVQLYAFWLLAATEIARDHSNWGCKDSHRLIELQPGQKRRIHIRNRSALERD